MPYSNLILQLNKSCNLRCPNCIWILRDKEFFTNSSMSLKNAKKIVDFFYSKGIKKISLQSEGEVLLYKGYKDLVVYCKKKGCNVKTLVTNGILIDKHTDFILSYLKGMLVSIDGPNYEEYVKVRGGTEKTFNRIISGLSNFIKERNRRKFNFPVSINCVVKQDNYHLIPDMIRLAERIGVDKINFRNFHPIFGGNGKKPLYASDNEVRSFLNNVKNDFLNSKISINMPKLYKNGGKSFACQGMLKDTIIIGSKGDFAPCCHLEADGNYGNYFVDTEGYRNNPTKLEFIKRLYETTDYNLIPDECKDCPRLVRIFK